MAAAKRKPAIVLVGDGGPLYMSNPSSFWAGRDGTYTIEERAGVVRIKAKVGPESLKSLMRDLRTYARFLGKPRKLKSAP